MHTGRKERPFKEETLEWVCVLVWIWAENERLFTDDAHVIYQKGNPVGIRYKAPMASVTGMDMMRLTGPLAAT